MLRSALSTLGCPELDLGEAARTAVSAGFDGLEIRSALGQPVSTDAPTAARKRWRAEMIEAGCSAVSLASYLRVCRRETSEDEWASQCTAELRLAVDLGAGTLRVFPGAGRGVQVDERVDDLGRRRLALLAWMAESEGVDVAVETHDSHPRAVDVRRLVGSDATRGVKVVWDVLHTWLAGEPAADSLRELDGRLALIQVKDVASQDNLSPLAPGAGAVPLTDVVNVIKSGRYGGWVSWEYERAWYPDTPSVAELAPAVHEWLADHLGR